DRQRRRRDVRMPRALCPAFGAARLCRGAQPLTQMLLNDEEVAMRAGASGEPRRWAIEHQIRVGEFFDAADMVPVAQAHIMADTESLGEAGIALLETLAAAPEAERRVWVPTLT